MLRDELVGRKGTWGGGEGESGHEERCARVHRQLKRIVKARGALDAREAAALREAEQLRVWRHYGYSSLLEYMEMEMGHSPRAALERLRVANAIVELPAIAEAMTQGELSFSAARELTRVATPETEDVWLDAASDKNLRQVEELVAGHRKGGKPSDPPDPGVRKRRLRFGELEPETVTLVRQAREILDRECGERLDDDAFVRSLARTVIDGAAGRERSSAPYQIAVVTCEQCKRSWQDGGGISVEMSAPAMEAARCDAQEIGTVDREHTAGTVTRARTTIPPAVRRKVKARDRGRCRVSWCRSSRNIDQHHLQPVSEGGRHTLENLITLCESHHLALHEGSVIIEGDATNATFTRRAHSSFADVQRAVEVARALRTLGFAAHEVKTAIDQARTHVGTATLSLEEWIKIALRYCPKPSS